ncbi:hypothetical protein B0T26DRAFT_677047 [Lasiosphaeria miniovina]|uniref:Uncharacterized protein n=1 Tax=Lasiosphaeria miniovina TaxID=1954250 RepID=A0AA40AB37_9PEZI|nr:uncharacterized protein B0T26DRAFT_677047 [Lasiosphaeria miniovina]KAK0712606.1 hypothetical protein B0T26DRAFT_677047 [Lasiosphaeria miniovina]
MVRVRGWHFGGARRMGYRKLRGRIHQFRCVTLLASWYKLKAAAETGRQIVFAAEEDHFRMLQKLAKKFKARNEEKAREEAKAEAEAKAGWEDERESGDETDAENQAQADNKTEPNNEAGSEANTKPKTAVGPETETRQEPRAGAQAGVGLEERLSNKSEAEDETESEAKTESDTEAGPESKRKFRVDEAIEKDWLTTVENSMVMESLMTVTSQWEPRDKRVLEVRQGKWDPDSKDPRVRRLAELRKKILLAEKGWWELRGYDPLKCRMEELALIAPWAFEPGGVGESLQGISRST